MSQPNHYQILEIGQNATPKEVKQAYRRLVKEFHPDLHPNGENRDRIVEINAAYEVLSDRQSRDTYDQLLLAQDPTRKRQHRAAEAQRQYQRHRQQDWENTVNQHQWLKEVYLPINQLLDQILYPLETQLYELAGDPFDDELMSNFLEYLEDCQFYLSQAQYKFSSQPNPVKYATIAASLYHCLNHLADGIDELRWFTKNYDEHYLHTGKELFRIAHRLRYEAQSNIKHLQT
jgi:molecular chaperone DnaJ